MSAKQASGGGLAERVPIDVLRMIFSYVHLYPRSHVLSLVCRRWLMIAREALPPLYVNCNEERYLAAFPAVDTLVGLPHDVALIPVNLKTLTVLDDVLTPDQIVRLTGLRSLVMYSNTLPSALVDLAPRLTHLACSYMHLTLDVKLSLTALQSLDLLQSPSNVDVQIFPMLHTLRCNNPGFLDRVTASMPSLTSVLFTATLDYYLHAHGIPEIAKLPNLRHLGLSCYYSDLKHIATAFTQLQLALTFVTDAERSAVFYQEIAGLTLVALDIYLLPTPTPQYPFATASLRLLTSLRVAWVTQVAFPHAELPKLELLRVSEFHPHMPVAEQRDWICNALTKQPRLRIFEALVELPLPALRQVLHTLQHTVSLPSCRLENVKLRLHAYVEQLRVANEVARDLRWIQLKVEHCYCGEHNGANEEERLAVLTEENPEFWGVDDEEVAKGKKYSRRK